MGGELVLTLIYIQQLQSNSKNTIMALEQEGIYNDLSPILRKKLEERIDSFGRYVRYKFNLERKNPDPTNFNGAIIFPSQYNLHPVQWKIMDSDENRPDKQKSKNIGNIEKVERDEKGNLQYRYFGLRVNEIEKGIKRFDMEKDEDRNTVAWLELHPKNGNGLFFNNQNVAVFNRVDDAKAAIEERKIRSERKKAMDAAELMSDAEVVQFADGMATEEWASTQDITLLRNKIESLAETTPVLFNDLVGSDKIKMRSLIKRAIDNNIFMFNAGDCSLSWVSTQQNIVTLGFGTGDKNDIERLGEWFLTAGKKADDVTKKLKSLIEKPVLS